LNGITYDTMNAKVIRKLRRRVRRLRAGKANVRPVQLMRLAMAIGRQKIVRGKEPTFEKDGRPPLTIPNHPGALSMWTADSILDVLEEDLLAEEGQPDG
jgi:hypothetical protein